MRELLEDLDPEVRRVCAYHQGWVNADGRPADGNTGKLLRPALVLLSARAAGGDVADAVHAAAATEMVHAFSLLHDDIMDGDEERRHRPTAWKAFGVPMALLAGDALLSLSHSALLARPTPGAISALRRLAADTQQLIAGQRLDLAFEEGKQVTVTEYEAMAGGKTAALMASSCAIGAEVVGGSKTLVEGLAHFGTRLGLAFQISDDILGIWGDPRKTGKSGRSDLVRRKKTYPVVAALSADGAAADRLRAFYRATEPLSQSELVEVASLIEEAGGLAEAHRAVAGCLAETERILGMLGLPAEARDSLLAVAAMVTGRNH
ncbi:polyprenyl synthetase family protein [Streptomyces sp. NPDC017991]|uniref:polyprenyl synthetase family protein n=1 Tax=Streptomyces sp. NPDC017991 TaxID=3365026 RepID=UPI0037B8B7FD